MRMLVGKGLTMTQSDGCAMFSGRSFGESKGSKVLRPEIVREEDVPESRFVNLPGEIT